MIFILLQAVLYSTADGFHSTAGGLYSTADGFHSTVGGLYSTADGFHTYADGFLTLDYFYFTTIYSCKLLPISLTFCTLVVFDCFPLNVSNTP